MKTVLITGVSTGIGRDASEYLINKGWMVFGSIKFNRCSTFNPKV